MNGASGRNHSSIPGTSTAIQRHRSDFQKTSSPSIYEGVRDSRHAVRRVIFTSSREVYGEPIGLPVEEGDPLVPINSYGASKLAGEAYCRAFRHVFSLQTVVLRLANMYGQRDTGGSFRSGSSKRRLA